MIKFDIRTRLYSVVALFAVGLTIVASTLIYFQSRAVLERRHTELKELTETVVSLVASQHAKVAAGQINEAEAKKRAL